MITSNPYSRLIDELRRMAPTVELDIQSQRHFAWIVVELPTSDIWWELECRSPESIGLHIHVPDDPDDVCFGPPEEYFTSVDDVLSYMKEQFQRTPA